ncbi:MAG: hypothetical protein M0D55_12210 [Elusimicrobiota bacterium]|nr:MAG: hypothetical protein M0D55_12210 [Elusimicrobiota bacterium]
MPLIAVLLAVAACDFKETRKGQITLTGAPIPLNGRAGTASLVAGPAELTFKKGSSDKTIAIIVKQPGRSDVELEAPVEKGYESGNFTLRGSQIGQPVDMTSARAWTVTGPTQRYVTRDDMGNRSCMVDVSFEPCDEGWTVTFKSVNGVDLGAFASRTATRCNERRGMPYACHRDPMDRPDFPRGPRNASFMKGVSDIGPANLKFD